MRVYQTVKNIIAYLDCKIVSRSLDGNAKKICNAHPEWADLSKIEKDSIVYAETRGGGVFV